MKLDDVTDVAFKLNQQATDKLLAESIEGLPTNWRTNEPAAWSMLGVALDKFYPATLLAGFLAVALLRLAKRQPEGEVSLEA